LAIAGSRGNLKFYTFPHLESTGLVTHGFTTRVGGVGSGPYESLNTAFHVGDSAANVIANRALACDALGINAVDLVAGRQVHGDSVSVVGLEDIGRGAISDEGSLGDTDALITGDKGVPLSSYYADCVPIFLLDPVKGVAALAHAGWKGTLFQIGRKTVERMCQIFCSSPQYCLAGIGPSIGPCCYEVDEQVRALFINNLPDYNDLFLTKSPGKWYLDLWEANRRTLVNAGLLKENILTSSLCTSCHNDIFFSYRAQNGRAGRMASIIMLK